MSNNIRHMIMLRKMMFYKQNLQTKLFYFLITGFRNLSCSFVQQASLKN